jgi:predicted permease
VFQGATRWQTYIALAIAGNLFGNTGLALTSVAMVAMIPILNVLCVAVLARYASPQRLPLGAIIKAILGNPLNWACAIGLGINLVNIPLPTALNDFIASLSGASLATGLLTVGAGLQPKELLRPTAPAIVSVALKLIVMPALALALAMLFGLKGADLAIVMCCTATPTSPQSYVLARQMGGDAPLIAQIITLQTALAALSMPIALALVH